MYRALSGATFWNFALGVQQFDHDTRYSGKQENTENLKTWWTQGDNRSVIYLIPMTLSETHRIASSFSTDTCGFDAEAMVSTVVTYRKALSGISYIF